ncbi:MAG TPA: phosphatidylserine decarboxylase [Chromatiales bacterium]|nr:phosphatidylserine decarboxylase [Chromatiales bacterium]
MTSVYILFQRLLPRFLLGRLVYRLSRIRTPWFKNALIRGFVRLYAVDVSEAERPVPEGYSSFNDFFTRRLLPGTRPMDPAPDCLCSPADGTVQQAGTIRDGRLIQAKGMHYTVAALLGDERAQSDYDGGNFLTVYLAPHDYHRVHAPAAGRLRRMLYVPGDRLAVNRRTAMAVPGLFAGNERLVCEFDTPDWTFSVVLVGALNVSSISTAWAGEVLPVEPRWPRRWLYSGQARVALDRGDYLGHFNLGSTVILLFPPGAVALAPELSPGRKLRVGERVGQLIE